jgi:hypothetical protein
VSRLSQLRARATLAWRVLRNPDVKPGRVLGRADADPDTEPAEGAAPTSACPTDSVVSLDACPICAHPERTLVGEFNRFVHFAQPPDEESVHAAFSLCHACGAVYAARRPVGPRYRWLLDHFEETLGRTEVGQQRAGKLAISSHALTDDDRAHLRRLAAKGVFVSEYPRPARKEYLPALLTDRLAASLHIEILGSLVELRGKRVLEVRSRLGSIPAVLKRLYSADVYAMAIFAGQQFLIEEVYGIPASSIDFDRFEIPYPGPWDLVVCNHMLTHAVRPGDFLATIRARLAPGGYIYLYNEPDDAEFLVEGKSMFNTLNAFHLQTYDAGALVRALGANGFRPVFVTRQAGHTICLAQAVEAAEWSPMGEPELTARRAAYLTARDAAILMLPESARWRVQDEWPSVIARAMKAGTAEVSAGGRIRVRR